jgi:hypothetical protein
MDTLKNDGVNWLKERLSDAKAHLKDIEARDYHGSSEEMKEEIAAEHSMCSADIWVIEEMLAESK